MASIEGSCFKVANTSGSHPLVPSSFGSTFFAARWFFGHICLVSLDQCLDPQGVGLAMAVAGKRIGATRGLNQNIGPDQAGVDMDRGDLAQADADFVVAEPRTLPSRDSFVADFDDS